MILQILLLTLTVVPPSTREDDTPISLSEIHGYNFYCGDSIGNYTETYVSDNSLTHEIATNHSIKYCVATTVDTDNRESVYSDYVYLIPSQPPSITCNANADLNNDGVVNAADLAIFKTHYFKRF